MIFIFIRITITILCVELRLPKDFFLKSLIVCKAVRGVGASTLVPSPYLPFSLSVWHVLFEVTFCDASFEYRFFVCAAETKRAHALP